MYGLVVVAISKMDVLLEDHSKIQGIIRKIGEDREKLIAARNTWEVVFAEYDDDPREIPDIPEIVNWIKTSVDAGIPWFYFMRATPDAMGLSMFMTVCGADADPQVPGRYLFDKDRFLLFIQKNLKNLEVFSEQYHIPDEVSEAATDTIMGYVTAVIQGTYDQPQAQDEGHREKMHGEALERLSLLERRYGLDPKVKEYFNEGKLYYSYITGGGYIGSIDTISYDPRYAKIVDQFAQQTGSLVYHVIEHEHTIALLYVSDTVANWLEERPQEEGVWAHVFDLDSGENKAGYIKLDVLLGALYRTSSRVYPELPKRKSETDILSALDSEVIDRLEILKTAGLLTDLDVTKIYTKEGVLCFSELHDILGEAVGVVSRIDGHPLYQQYAEAIATQVPYKLYFMMTSRDKKLAFLFVSDDESDWLTEKLDLEKRRPLAIVVDPETRTASLAQISYQMVNGGPVCFL